MSPTPPPPEGQEPTCPIARDVPLTVERVDHAGLGLHVRFWGDPAAPPLLLQHGAWDHGRTWDWIVADLVRDFYCIVPDLRGHGWSDWAPGGGYGDVPFLLDFAKIMSFLAERGVGGPIPIVGHSAGGNIALRYGALCPDRVSHLMAIEGLGVSQTYFEEITAAPLVDRWKLIFDRHVALDARGVRRFPNHAAGVEHMAKFQKELTPTQVQHLASMALVEDREGWRWRHDKRAQFRSVRPTAPAEYATMNEAIQCPVELLYGTASFAEVPGPEDRLAPFRDAQLHTFEGVGHQVHHERPGAIIELVRTRMTRGTAR